MQRNLIFRKIVAVPGVNTVKMSRPAQPTFSQGSRPAMTKEPARNSRTTPASRHHFSETSQSSMTSLDGISDTKQNNRQGERHPLPDPARRNPVRTPAHRHSDVTLTSQSGGRNGRKVGVTLIPPLRPGVQCFSAERVPRQGRGPAQAAAAAGARVRWQRRGCRHVTQTGRRQLREGSQQPTTISTGR